MNARPLLVILVALTHSTPLFAHGGEDHEHAPVAPAALKAASHQASATTEDVEVLLKWETLHPGTDNTVQLFLADARTNQPVTDARVELEGQEAGIKTTATTTASPGVYTLVLKPAREGSFTLVVSISAKELEDLVPVEGVVVRAPPAKEEQAAGVDPLRAALLGVPVLVLILALAWRGRGRTKGGAAVGAMLLAAIPSVGRAHGGEDHGDPAPTQAAHVQAGAVVELQKETQFLIGLRTAPAGVVPIARKLNTLGTVRPRAGSAAQLASPVAGHVTTAGEPLLPGMPVRKGQTLLVMEGNLSGTERAQVAQSRATSRANVAQAQQRLDQARRDRGRLELARDTVAQKDVQRAELAVSLAEEELTRARADLEALASDDSGNLKVNRFPIKAPIDGYIVSVNAAPGSYVEAGKPLAEIVNVQSVWVEAEVFEQDVARLENVSKAFVIVGAYPDERFEARLVTLSRAMHAETLTFPAIFELKNPDQKLRLGMSARVQILEGGAEDRVAIPKSAVISDRGERWVFVKTGAEAFELRAVSVGDSDGTMVAVKEGVHEGDLVVTSGVYELRATAGGR